MVVREPPPLAFRSIILESPASASCTATQAPTRTPTSADALQTFLPLLRRLRLDLSPAHITPIGTQHRPSRLGKRLHHCPPPLWRQVAVEGLKELFQVLLRGTFAGLVLVFFEVGVEVEGVEFVPSRASRSRRGGSRGEVGGIGSGRGGSGRRLDVGRRRSQRLILILILSRPSEVRPRWSGVGFF